MPRRARRPLPSGRTLWSIWSLKASSPTSTCIRRFSVTRLLEQAARTSITWRGASGCVEHAMPFVELTLDLRGLAPDVAEEATFNSGALSVTLTDSGDDAVLEPAPGEIRLWPATRMQALFPEGTDAAP